MHVPDGFLDAPTSIATGAVAAVGVAVALRGARKELDDRTAPMAGLVATFVFAGQMMNFPVAAGTSGHLLGGALAAVLAGPWTAVLCVSVVLLVQALFMADGGITALGTNITLMALVGVGVGWLVFVAARAVLPKRLASVGPGRRGRRAASASRSPRWCSPCSSRSAAPPRSHLTPCSPRWSPGTRSSASARPSSPGWWSARVVAVRPDLVYGARPALERARRSRSASRRPDPGRRMRRGMKRMQPPASSRPSCWSPCWSPGVGSYYASTHPDGLNFVAEKTGFSDQEKSSATSDGPLAGYETKGIDDDRLSGGVAGVAGCLLVLTLAGGLSWVVRRRGRPSGAEDAASRRERPRRRPDRGLDGRRTRPPPALPRPQRGAPGSGAPQDPRAGALHARRGGDPARVVPGLRRLPRCSCSASSRLAACRSATSRSGWSSRRRSCCSRCWCRSSPTGPQTEVLGVSVSEPGLLAAWGLLAKGTLGVLASLTLAATTEPVAVLAGLRRLRMPDLIVQIMGFMIRYLDVVTAEMGRMTIGMRSRGCDPRSPRHWPVLARSLGALFIRSYERGERVHLAMLSRGYTGTLPDTTMPHPHRRDAPERSRTDGHPRPRRPRPGPRLPRRPPGAVRRRPARPPAASGSRCSAPTAPARPRSCCTSTASSPPGPARSRSPGCRSTRRTSRRSGAASAWSSRTPTTSCSWPRSARTWRSARPTTGVRGAELERRVVDALEQVGMADFADRPPHHLSFGQRRRVAVATVLAMEPEILVLDEPSSNLDPASRRELADILRSLDVTVLMVTHDLPYALELCPRVRRAPRRRGGRRRRDVRPAHRRRPDAREPAGTPVRVRSADRLVAFPTQTLPATSGD